MKSKWNYAKAQPVRLAVQQRVIILRVLLLFIPMLLVASCGTKEEPKHIASGKPTDLSGLEQPANKVVFSDVKTVVPVQQSLQPVLDAEGVLSYDPDLLNTISARFSGRIEKLYVHFNFQPVKAGEHIMDIYSPEILTAQQDFIHVLQAPGRDESMVQAARNKLMQLGLTGTQIRQIEQSLRAINPLPVFSAFTGHIHDIGTGSGTGGASMGNGMAPAQGTNTTQPQIENLPSSQSSALSLREGMYVQSGQAMFSVYNTSRVWAVLNIYPKDADHIKKGNRVALTLETDPGKTYEAVIGYIEPVAGQNASAIKARVYLSGSNVLKIGTLLHAKITCTEIQGLWLPRQSVVDLGSAQAVFIKKENHFVARKIEAGFTTDSLVQVIAGLNTGEAVAADAQYMVDSESFTNPDNQ